MKEHIFLLRAVQKEWKQMRMHGGVDAEAGYERIKAYGTCCHGALGALLGSAYDTIGQTVFICY